MKKHLLHVVALLLLTLHVLYCSSPVHAESPLRIGTEGTYRPMSFYDASGHLTGFEVELVEAICKSAKLDCEFVIMDFDGMVPALQAGKIDAIASGMRITEKRKQIVDFANKYYTPYSQFVSCQSNVTSVLPADTHNLTLGTQSGTSGADYLKALYADAGTIRLYKTMDEVYLDLASGRLDLALSSAFIGYDFLKSDKGKGCRFIGPKLTDKKYFGDGVGMALRKGDDKTRALINAGIKTVMDNGTYDTLNAKYWPFSVR